MKKSLASAGACASVLAVTFAATPAYGSAEVELAPLSLASERGVPESKVVPESYVVTVDEGSDPRAVAAELGLPVEHVFTKVLNGFATSMDPGALHRARVGVEVEKVTQSLRYDVGNGDPVAEPASWGLDRLDQGALPLDGSYAPKHNGKGVTAYVIDSGIAPNHPEFQGRASIGFDSTGGNGFDGNGHGTHVAGVIGSKAFGVAKNVRLVGVKVLTDQGTGSTGSLLAGMEWVANNAQGPAVANMSLHGPKDPTLHEAAHNLVVNSGVFLSASAGDYAGEADEVSPASAEHAFAVAASNRKDQSTKSTNHGKTIDLYGPGANITSTLPHGKTGQRSGTSVAAAHVGGAAALYLQAHPGARPADIGRGLRDGAAKGVIQNVPNETTPDLVQVTPAARQAGM